MALKTILHIIAQLQNGSTILKQGYCTIPFRITDITEDRRKRKLELMLMCSSPGVLSGDVYDFTIEVKAGAWLQLRSQSYQRLFTMKGSAQQHTNVRIEEGATFQYLPHPVVPHEDSSFSAVTNIYLQEKSCLFWGEIITCGRMLNEEVFRMKQYRNLVNVYYKERLMIRENVLIQPDLIAPLEMGLLEGYTHQASLLYWNDLEDLTATSNLLYELFGSLPDVCFGVSTTPGYGLIVRILGSKAEQLYKYLHEIQQVILQHQTQALHVD